MRFCVQSHVVSPRHDRDEFKVRNPVSYENSFGRVTCTGFFLQKPKVIGTTLSFIFWFSHCYKNSEKVSDSESKYKI